MVEITRLDGANRGAPMERLGSDDWCYLADGEPPLKIARCRYCGWDIYYKRNDFGWYHVWIRDRGSVDPFCIERRCVTNANPRDGTEKSTRRERQA